MKLLIGIVLIGAAVTSTTLLARHYEATGAEGGVYWLIGLGALFGVASVVVAALEARFGSDRR